MSKIESSSGPTPPKLGRGQSAAGWSDPGANSLPPRDTAVAPHPFEVGDHGRYHVLESVGRGGMGHVVVAHDRRLGRDVALKKIAAPADAPALARRLAREARVTAVLEHPSIVPVYDAGVGDDGRMYYTMRLIHGRSLAIALHECETPTARLGLLRPFLAVCEALAFAHNMGIVHRDLKPANIMVGPFGETQVVDWGLAGITHNACAAGLVDDSLDGPSDAPVGTPAYMSPEQARGDPAEARADVWSLGAILHEIVVGRPLLEPVDFDDRQTGVPLRTAYDELGRPGGAPELAAIIEKATAAQPANRYRDGSQLAADVARFLDGQRVDAHTYTTLELGRRLIRRLRVPLAIGLAALLASGIVLALTFQRTTRERNRAVAAENRTRLALDDVQRTTGWALNRQAIAELDTGALSEASVLAAHALRHGESADARGIIAAGLASPGPTRAESIELPGCKRVVPGSWSMALCQEDDGIALWELEPVRLRWRRALPFDQVAMAAPQVGRARIVLVNSAKELVVLDANRGDIEQHHLLEITTGRSEHLHVSHDGLYVAVTEGRVVNIVSLTQGRVTFRDRTCGNLHAIVAVASGTDRFATLCSDGAVTLIDAATGDAHPRGMVRSAATLRPIAGALDGNGRVLAVGGLSGDLVFIDLETGTQTDPLSLGSGAVTALEFLADPTARVVVNTERAGASVVDVATRAVALRLPLATSLAARATANGLISGGRRAGRWRLPTSLTPRSIRAPAGLAAVSATADGRWIAAARGDGRVSVWDGNRGAVVAEFALSSNAVKSVDFSPDGTRLAVSTRDGRGPAAYATGTWQPTSFDEVLRPARRLGFDDTGRLTAIHYNAIITYWSADGVSHERWETEMFDLAWTTDRRAMIALAVDGGIWRILQDRLERFTTAAGATSLATWDEGNTIATGHDSGVQIHPRVGPPRWLPAPGVALLDLVVSHNQRFLIGGAADGTVVVWRLADDRIVAILRGHRQRVASVVALENDVVLSAGWDGVVLRWDLKAIDLPIERAVAEMESRWALDLRMVLATEGS